MPVSEEIAATTPEAPAFATRAVLAVAGVVGIAHLACSIPRGYWFDEAYMLAIGRYHLAWGSADQPPLTPALAGVLGWLAPDSVVVLRLPAVLATAAAVVVAALIAREFGGDRRAQILTAAAQGTALWVTLMGHWLTPYTLEPVQWLVLFWLVVRWVRVRDDRLLLVLGVVVGVAAETKFQVLLLCVVLAGAVLVCGPRELLRRRMFWGGVALALLIALPTLVWQARNGWPQLRMGAVVAGEAAALYGGRAGVAVTLILTAGIAGTVLALYGLWRLLRVAELRDYRFLGVTAVVLYVFFVVTVGRPYYLNGIHGVLIAAGALGLQRRRETGGRLGWVAWPAYALSTLAAAGLLVASLGAAKPDAPQEIASRTAAAYHALPPDQQATTVVMGESYIIAAYGDVYRRTYDLPPLYSTNRSYGYFPPPPESAHDVLYVGKNPDELRPHFASCTTLYDAGTDQHGFLCHTRQEPWDLLWPRLRHLDVS
ncbi:ArnT family glycosyltransferase [Nocardia sp. NPDC003482]